MSTFIKSLYKKYVAIRKKIRYRGNMRKKIAQADTDIRQLTDEEKRSIKAYWNQYGVEPDYESFRWYYSVNGCIDPRYISEDIYANHIWTKLNDMSRCNGLEDKNLFDLIFAGEKQAETVVHNINGSFVDSRYQLLSEAEAYKLIEHEETVVIKPAVESGQGKGIICIKGSDFPSYRSEYKKDYIVQRLVKQHPSFAAFNDSSVNVVRMTSVMLNNRVHILDSIIRIGATGQFTDHKNIAVGIDDQGRLKDFGVTVKGKKVDELPNGFRFAGKSIVAYDKMKEAAIRMHSRIPQARLIGWDITVNEKEEVVIIEANFGFPGIGRGQDCNGPFFGAITDELLDFLFERR